MSKYLGIKPRKDPNISLPWQLFHNLLFLTLVSEANQLLQIQYHSYHLPIKRKQFPHFNHKLEAFLFADV